MGSVAFFRIFAFCLLASSALAAIPVQQVTSEKRGKYLESGVFVGGHDQGAVVLAGFRQNFDKSTGLERLVFDISEKGQAKPVLRPGFFHVAIQKDQRRVVMDLQNMVPSKVDAQHITRLLHKSKYFSSASMYYDEINKNLTVVMALKTRVKVEVFELTSLGKPGRIVIDVKGM